MISTKIIITLMNEDHGKSHYIMMNAFLTYKNGYCSWKSAPSSILLHILAKFKFYDSSAMLHMSKKKKMFPYINDFGDPLVELHINIATRMTIFIHR